MKLCNRGRSPFLLFLLDTCRSMRHLPTFALIVYLTLAVNDCDAWWRKAGSWGGWTGWSSCSRSCGTGTKSRQRTCNNRNCNGHSSQSLSCKLRECPGYGQQPGCGEDPADMVFILDASGSVGSRNFKKMLTFVGNLVDEFVIGPKHTQVATLTYSTKVYNQFHLNKFTSKSALKSKIQRIKYKRGYTYTSKAIRYARLESFKGGNGVRTNSRKIAIIITDGKSASPTKTKKQAKLLRKDGVTIFSIGVGKGAKKEELESMATDISHVFVVNKFDALGGIKRSLAKKTCDAGKTSVICEHKSASLSCPVGEKVKIISANYGRTAPSSKENCVTPHDKDTNCRASKSLDIVQSRCEGKSTCSLTATNRVFGDPCVGTYKYLKVVHRCIPESKGCGEDPADMVFILDASGSVGSRNFKKMLNFVGNLVDEFEIGPKHTQVATLIYSNKAYEEFNFKTFTSKSEIKSKLKSIRYRRGSTRTGQAIKYARKKFFKAGNGVRKNSRKIAIVITDGKSNYPVKTKQEAKLLRDEGVTIFSIGVGKGAKREELESIASDPDISHVFVVENFDALGGIKKSLAKKTCEAGKTSVICEHKSASISCPVGEKVKIISANYGRTAPSSKDNCVTPHDKDTNCRAPKSLDIVQSRCEGKSTCSLTATNRVFGDPCVGTYKYLKVVHRCIPKKPCSCRVSGDPHYKTYDGQWIHFQGICKYLLTELTNKRDPCWFSISVKNENRGGNKRVSFTRLVDVQLRNAKIRLLKKRKVEVNGGNVPLRYEQLGDFSIWRSGLHVRVETSCGLVVTWDGRSAVSVSVPAKYRSKLQGICGDCDGKKNDYKTRGGKDVRGKRNKFNLIGESWKVFDDSGSQQCTPPGPPGCTDQLRKKAYRDNACGYLNPKNTRSPFKTCIKRNKLEAKEYFENCLYDYCAYAKKTRKELRKAICAALEAFAEVCLQKGITQRWRKYCPLQCGKNKVFKHSTSACPATCVNPDAPKTCKLPRTEDCVCRRGYVLSDNKCVRRNSCGCYKDGKYYPLNTRVRTCSKVYYCKKGRRKPKLRVRKIRCIRNSVCKMINNQVRCVCKDGYTRKGKRCRPIVGCLVKKEPNCTYRLYGNCQIDSGAQGCYYSVFLKTNRRGKVVRPIKINNKAVTLRKGPTINNCLTINLQDNALVIQEKSCPAQCKTGIILNR